MAPLPLNPHRLLLYARTARHLRFEQVCGRVRNALRKGGQFVRNGSAPPLDPKALDGLRGLAKARACWHGTEPPQAPPERLIFLNRTVELGQGIPWHDPALPLLWRYHLHAFSHAAPYCTGNDTARMTLYAHMLDWIGENPPGSRPGWDAYPLSGRLLEWALTEAVHEFAQPILIESALNQVEWLLGHIEYGTGGNHLIKNAAALSVWGALAHPDALRTGLALLERELAEQVLPDGVHYERSPMYHALVLEDLLIVHAALPEPPGFLVTAITAMAKALPLLCHPDGDIALFGDAAFGEAPLPGMLTSRARKQLRAAPPASPISSYALPDAGFFVLRPRDLDHWLVARCGEPGPAHQPGHAHNDILSFELSVDGQRMVADSGVHGYAESPYRAYCRSVHAHNTVCVDGGEPLECWDTFRVARRYTPDPVDFEPNGPRLRASYRAWQGYRHAREITWEADTGWRISDTVSGKVRRAESYLHFHPDCQVTPESDGIWRVQRDRTVVLVRPFGMADARCVAGADSPHQGWYCPRFGVALAAPTLVFQAAAPSKEAFGYAIVQQG